MGKPDRYTIDLKNLSEDNLEFVFQLDEELFSELDTQNIRKGDLQCILQIRQTSGGFEFSFHTEGVVTVACDRCLDDMEFEVNTDDSLTVKFGDENSDEGDGLIVVAEDEGVIDVAWHIYEFIALSLPLQYMHEDAECNEAMISELNKHVVGDGCEEGVENQSSQDTDPRWNELKKIKDNN